MNVAARPRFWETVLVVGAPLALAILELFHPPPIDLFTLDLKAWLIVHYGQTVLFPLSAIAVVALMRGRSGIEEWLCRIAMFVFAVSYTVFDTAAGVVTGVLVAAAKQANVVDMWRAPIVALWTDPIIGGAPGTAPLLAVAGSIAWSVGTIAAAVAMRRAGTSWPPVLLIGLSGLGLAVFKTHAWPGGPLTFGAAAAAAAWLQFIEKRR